jgi:hypothetical protein
MSLFTNKKVVLCGPAPHITETKQDFSGYDYVCRLNAMIPLSDELIEATGNRIDGLVSRESASNYETRTFSIS